MMRRCYSNKYKKAENYKQLGIKVYKEWHNPVNFVKDMDEPAENLSLERRNTYKGYYKENCKWATRLEQANNTTRSFYVEFAGISKTPWQWVRLLISDRYRKAFVDRLYKGWPFHLAVSAKYGVKLIIEQRKENWNNRFIPTFEKQETIKEALEVM